jgi:hypothetical protein
VHSPAMIIITNHLLELHAEADANRLAKQAKQAQRSESKSSNRIAAALASLRSVLSNSDAAATPLPKLTDYPYRS